MDLLGVAGCDAEWHKDGLQVTWRGLNKHNPIILYTDAILMLLQSADLQKNGISLSYRFVFLSRDKLIK